MTIMGTPTKNYTTEKSAEKNHIDKSEKEAAEEESDDQSESGTESDDQSESGTESNDQSESDSSWHSGCNTCFSIYCIDDTHDNDKNLSDSSLDLVSDNPSDKEEEDRAVFTEEEAKPIDWKVDWPELYHKQLNWELEVIKTHISDFTPENIMKIKWFCPEEVAEYYKSCIGKTPIES